MRRLVWTCARGWDVALFVAALALAYVALTGPAWGMTVTVDGVTATVTADEPTANVPNADGLVTPLDDLAAVEFLYDVGAGPVLCASVPATSPAGGGTVSAPCAVPVRDKEVKLATFTAVAVDTSGNRSAPSDPVTHRLDRLPPEKPR